MNGNQVVAAASAIEVEASNGALVGRVERKNTSGGGRADLVHVALRLVCMAASVTALSMMVTAKQAGVASIYGFRLQLYSKWSFSNSFEYLVAVSAAATGYSLVQLLISSSRLLRKSPVIATRNQAWLIFAADQILAYAMMSAGSAASGVTNLNRTGIKHTPLPDFCKALHSFCDHVIVSIVLTFFGCVLLASSAVLDIVCLSKH